MHSYCLQEDDTILRYWSIPFSALSPLYLLSLYLSFSLYLSLSHSLSLYLSLIPSLSLSLFISLFPQLSLSLFLSLYLFPNSLSLSLSVCLSLNHQVLYPRKYKCERLHYCIYIM